LQPQSVKPHTHISHDPESANQYSKIPEKLDVGLAFAEEDIHPNDEPSNR
jgi:hypothetical protein